MTSFTQADLAWVTMTSRPALLEWARSVGLDVGTRPRTERVRAQAKEWLEGQLAARGGAGPSRPTTPTGGRPASEEVVHPRPRSAEPWAVEESAEGRLHSRPWGNTPNPQGSGSYGEGSDGSAEPAAEAPESGEGRPPRRWESDREGRDRPGVPHWGARPAEEVRWSCPASDAESRYYSDRGSSRGNARAQMPPRDPFPRDQPTPASYWERDPQPGGYHSERWGRRPPSRDWRSRAEDVQRPPSLPTGSRPDHLNRSEFPAPRQPAPDPLTAQLLQRQIDLEEARLAESREMRRVQERLLQLQLDAAARPAGPAGPGRAPRDTTLIKTKGHLIQPWNEDEDLREYLELFESVCTAGGVPTEEQGLLLVSLLTGKAKRVVMSASPGALKDYAQLRAILHESFDFTADSFRLDLRSQARGDHDTYLALLRHSSRTWDCWMALEKASTVQDIKDVCMREVLIKSAPDPLRIVLLDAGPMSAEDMAQKAHCWEKNRQRVKAESTAAKNNNANVNANNNKNAKGGNANNDKNANVSNSSSHSKASKDGGKPDVGKAPKSGGDSGSQGKGGGQARGTGVAQSRGKGAPFPSGDGKQGYQCHLCGKDGHFRRDCPSQKAKGSPAEKVNFVSEAGELVEHVATIQDRSRSEGELPPVLRKEIVDLVLNGDAIRALPDSGASLTCVKADSVLPSQYTGEVVPVDYADGYQGEVPLARVKLSWEGDEGPEGILRRVGVCASQKLDCYLGMDYLKEMRAAITRSQAQKKAKARLAAMGDSPLEVPWDTPLPEKSAPVAVSFGWGDETTTPREPVVGSGEGASVVDPMALWTPGTLELHDTAAFKEALVADSSLEQLRQRALPCKPALEELGSPAPRYAVYWEGGLLYSEPTTPSLTGPGRRLVVPLKYRGELLRLGHEIPTAGHLGIAKTKARVLNSFFWPTISRDLENFVKSCDVCQVSGKSGGRSTAPLVSMPAVGTPFQRVGMDIVGPIDPPSASGKRYILVVVDYATRYPEAVALRSITTKSVAEALMGIFARVGFPDEVISDRGTQFVSEVMHSLWHMSGVQHHPSTSYHPETNGLCERFNGTLKSMLLAFTNKHGRQWEKYLPYLLFAYREVPQESTGFSPFELLYGWRVKGPLQIVRDGWEGRHTGEDQAIVPYVLNIRERLKELMDLSAENLAAAQSKQKSWYDRKARVSSYEEGQEVLLLVPVRQNKMTAAWSGPHKVVRKVSEVNYVVDRMDKPGAHSTYHVNMMKPYVRRTEFTMSICEGDTLYEGEAGIPDLLRESQESCDLSEAQLSPELSDRQRGDLLETLAPFNATFSGKPGVVKGVVHDVDTGDAAPIRTNPYKVSSAVGENIRKEVLEMLQMGIIEVSSSAWASPIVLVQKKDRSTRFCTDYRRLNVITKSDAHPLPRIDDLLDKLGPAKFITTMDLTKGYWQVPLTERAKERSAFTCPEGLFQYRVMPFGMKNAPATFQRLMNSVLRGLEAFAVAYLDDIAIYSLDWRSHLLHLTAVMTRLQAAGLTVKVPKCQFAQGEVDYLGHCVGRGHLRPLRAKVEAIADWPRPTTQRAVRAFLGTAGYYRSFVPSYSTIAAPLTGLLVKKAPRKVEWTAECQKAFDTLKAILCDEPVLTSPDPRKPYYVQTDASDVGIGAVLSQRCDEGGDRPVVYLSRKLLAREQRWSVAERECLAVVWALKKLQPYLYGVPFIVQTDHNPLTFLHSLGDASGKLLRWSLALQDYQFEVQYRSGAKNGNADGLSRQTFADAA